MTKQISKFFLATIIGLLLLPAINSSAADSVQLQADNVVLELGFDPLSINVIDQSGNIDSYLGTTSDTPIYILKGEEKIPLTGCAFGEKSMKSADGTCSAGGASYKFSAKIENEYEFSIVIEPAGDPVHKKIGYRFNLPANESIYGIKEHVVGDGKSGTDFGSVQKFATLDQRGMTVEMYTRPTISIYSPFHINSAGYGLFFETTWPGVYDLGDTEPLIADISFEGPSLKMIFTMGPDMGDIIERHTDRVGKTLLPPKWAASVFKWRDDHINLPVLYDNSRNPSPFNSMVYEDIMMMDKLGIPTGVYWIDRPWATGPFGYDDFEFDTNRLPEPEKMIKWLKEKHGKQTLLWVAPWAYGKMRDYAEEKGYLAPNSDKVIDFTNPEAVEWWQNEFHKMFDLDVAGFKLDRCEEVIPSSEEDIYFDGRTGREVHNEYPLMYAKAVQGACQKFRGDDCLVMPRSGFTGSQKYAVFWGGDTSPTWRGLRSAVISCIRANIMGFPVWGSDTGGYGVSETQDLFSRWMQVSAFHPIMEIGGSGSHEPWAAQYEPKYDQVGIDNFRFYAKLHTELLPYNYSNMYYAHKTGRPIVRPLVYHWPDDVRVRDEWTEFMFGEWILAAPVLTQDARSREVYLPEGKWYDFWNSASVFDGPKNYLVEADIYTIPVFIRAGAIIPLDILDTETGWGTEFSAGKFTIAAWPDTKASQLLYYNGEKEGVITAQDKGDTVVINVSEVPETALLRVRTDKPASITIDGKEIERHRKEKNFIAAEEGWFWIPKEQTVWIKSKKNGNTVITKLFE